MTIISYNLEKYICGCDFQEIYKHVNNSYFLLSSLLSTLYFITIGERSRY